MAAPLYDHDLTAIIENITATTGWTALGGGAAGLGVGPDFVMQGTNALDKQITAAEKGQIFGAAAAITPAANTHFFLWGFLATPGLANTLALRGLAAIVGTGTGAYTAFHLEGNETYGAVGRVGKCYAVRHNTSALGTPPYRTLTGSPGANPQYFGFTANITGSVKSANLGVSAIRYGTGAYITAGDVPTPATFLGFASLNDAIANRWGILTQVGASFELQGRFVIGQTKAGTPTAARFESSNAKLAIVDTPHSLTDFTQIIIDHASTVVILTNLTIDALGTNNPGRFVVNNAATVVTLTGGTWTGIGITTLRAGVTATNKTWRGCGQVTMNGATITNCIFDGTTSTAALLTANPSLITGTDFTFSTAGHAVEATTPGTYGWTGNTDTGYTGTRGSNLVAATGSTDAMFYNNSGGLITLNVGGGGQSPSVRNGAGATTQVNATFTLTLTSVPSGVQATIVNSSTRTELFNQTSTGVNMTYQHSGGETVDILFNSTAYDPNVSDIYDITLPSTDSSIKVQMLSDPNYLNP